MMRVAPHSWLDSLHKKPSINPPSFCWLKLPYFLLFKTIMLVGLEHEWIMTFHSVGNFIIPTVTHSIIFQRDRLKPPTHPVPCLTHHLCRLNNGHFCWCHGIHRGPTLVAGLHPCVGEALAMVRWETIWGYDLLKLLKFTKVTKVYLLKLLKFMGLSIMQLVHTDEKNYDNHSKVDGDDHGDMIHMIHSAWYRSKLLPSGYVNSLLLKMVIEIVSFPINSMVDLSIVIYVNVYQRVNLHFPMVFLWFSHGFPMVFLWFSYGFPMVFLWFLWANPDKTNPDMGNPPGQFTNSYPSQQVTGTFQILSATSECSKQPEDLPKHHRKRSAVVMGISYDMLIYIYRI